ncbi:acid-sensing ion channel 4-A-like [Liolophura sinensis]|uniref:acid-sensing ion channel 4-A-like n=1 Tax=Liolophura sinensis TaxID=3198878 RepID=UPI003158CDD6
MTKARVDDLTVANPGISGEPKVSVSENVNISGLRQVCEKGTSFARRLIWLLLLLAGTSFLVYQVYRTVNYFLSGPTIQTTSTVYPSDVPFPAVTICNQNTIRNASRLEDVDLSQMFGGRTDFTLETFYKQSGHTIESMIKRCVFNGVPCRREWFTAQLTDAGHCYTFNGANKDGGLRTALRGKNGGLTLELNVEQYEYSYSRTNTAGVYLLIHDQSEIPNLVLNRALAVTSGYHTSISLGLLNPVRKINVMCSRLCLVSSQKQTVFRLRPSTRLIANVKRRAKSSVI